jgi:hypothetical protein
LVLCSCIDFSAGRTIWQGVPAFPAAAFRGVPASASLRGAASWRTRQDG